MLLGFLPLGGAWADAGVDARIADLVTSRAASGAAGLFVADRSWLARIYRPEQPGPVWFTTDGARPAVDAALRELRAAAEHGLAPDDYRIDQVERLVAEAKIGAGDREAVARADVALTVAFLRLLSDIRYGRVPAQRVAPHYRVPAKDAAFVAELREAVARERVAAMLDAAAPAFPQYARLKRLLARYRTLAAEPDPVLPPLPASRRSVAPGDSYAGVRPLHAMLVRLGDLPPDVVPPESDHYAPTLVEAVRRFQLRHGLEPDGVLGRETLAALQVPLAVRVSQIALSLERLRWLPELPRDRLIAINIPSFRLWAVADLPGTLRPALTMPVIVGRAMRSETPVFIGEMRHVEFSPYWNVPPGILRNELLPRLAADPSYLEREDMEIVSIGRAGPATIPDVAAGIAALASGKARLRQRPGAKNALGGVKFVLPNTMDVYLHATPARALFERTRRDFSHGCIRVRDPVELALFVLGDRPEWTRGEIEAAMASGVNRTVPLRAPIPVVVFYTTAIVDDEGRAIFLADVYGHDRTLLDALSQTGRRTP